MYDDYFKYSLLWIPQHQVLVISQKPNHHHNDSNEFNLVNI